MIAKFIKKTTIIVMFVAVCMMAGSGALTAKNKATAQHWNDGEWIGVGQGYMGVVKVNVTVKKGSIVKIDVLSNSDTPQYFDKAKAAVTSQIIRSQNTKVDGYTGATYSSQGISKAVANALAKSAKKK